MHPSSCSSGRRSRRQSPSGAGSPARGGPANAAESRKQEGSGVPERRRQPTSNPIRYAFRLPIHRRLVARAVRHDGHLPLAVRPADARAGLPHRHHGDPLRPHEGPVLAPHDQILDAPVRHQLRHRRGHGPDPRIRIRDQLVQLLPLRGRHFRRAAGHRGHSGVLPRIDLHRRDVLRLAQGQPGFPPHGHVAHGLRRQPLGVVDSGRQLVDAIPRGVRLQPRNRAQRDDLVLGRGAVARGGQQVLPHRHLIVRPRRAVRRVCCAGANS